MDDKETKGLLNQILSNQESHRSDSTNEIQNLKSSVDLLRSDINIKFDSQTKKIDDHVKEDKAEFSWVRTAVVQMQLSLAKLQGIKAVLVYLIPGVSFIAWLVFKTVFGIEE
jgi:hypothetical protein